MVDRIIVFKEKHGDSYFDASTEELLAKACLKVLRERQEYNWYYAPDKPVERYTEQEQAVLAMSNEQIDMLPEPIKSETLQRKDKLEKRYLRANREYEQDNEWFVLLENLLSLPESEAIAQVRTFRSGRTTPLAYALLSDRQDGEYESFEIVNLQKV